MFGSHQAKALMVPEKSACEQKIALTSTSHCRSPLSFLLVLARYVHSGTERLLGKILALDSSGWSAQRERHGQTRAAA